MTPSQPGLQPARKPNLKNKKQNRALVALVSWRPLRSPPGTVCAPTVRAAGAAAVPCGCCPVHRCRTPLGVALSNLALGPPSPRAGTAAASVDLVLPLQSLCCRVLALVAKLAPASPRPLLSLVAELAPPLLQSLRHRVLTLVVELAPPLQLQGSCRQLAPPPLLLSPRHSSPHPCCRAHTTVVVSEPAPPAISAAACYFGETEI
nr:unnamed protein product [Digitaria exilis]